MNEAPEGMVAEPVEVETFDVGTQGLLVKAEIDQQQAFAVARQRSTQRFARLAESWACLNEQTAEQMTYSLPRGGKVIEGPSVRMAEILVLAWTNCRVATRIVEIGDTMLRVEGMFFDLENNVWINHQVARRITKKSGARYNDDMIATTANAASSVARRNAIFSGIPQALWKPIWAKARLIAAGSADTLEERRVKAMEYLKGMGAEPSAVFEVLGVKGIEDVTLDHLATLKGIINAVRDGEITVADAFGDKTAPPENVTPGGMEGLKAALVIQATEPGTVAPDPATAPAQDAAPAAAGGRGKANAGGKG